eukprot:COSAG04_NODE_505_length_13342_cov_2.786529_3_plen_255_part_00
MPLSMSICSFLTYYDGLGGAQRGYLQWLHDRKEDIRRQLLLGQLEEDRLQLDDEAARHAAGAVTASDDAEDAKDRLGSLEKAEQSALSGVEAARLARNAEELETAEAKARMATHAREEAEAEAEAAETYIVEVQHLRDDAAAAAEEAAALLERVAERLHSGQPTFDVVDKLGLGLANRLALFRAWEDADVEMPGLPKPFEQLEAPEPEPATAAARAAAAASALEAAGGGSGLTALDLVRLVRSLQAAGGALAFE